MSRKKLHHFAEMKTFPHVYEQDYSSGELKTTVFFRDYFKNDRPMVLEIGCGRGDYTMAMAQFFPEKNYIGMDIRGARLWHGAKQSFENHIKNVAFLRGRAEDLLAYFKPGEISEIWIPFPDPRPRKSEREKRLISSRMLALYRVILAANGVVHLKADHLGFFENALEVLREQGWKVEVEIRDLYATQIPSVDEMLLKKVQTFYEKKYLAQGKPIFYLRTKKPSN